MSSKSSKRKQRRINQVEEEEVKKVEDSVDATPKNNENESDVAKTNDAAKNSVEEPENQENGKDDEHVPEEAVHNGDTKTLDVEPEKSTESEETPVTQPETFTSEIGSEIEISESFDSKKAEEDDVNSEMEPLSVDTEEVELQFDTNSEMSSDLEKSPMRAATRRSQYRSIPTPKTPKSLDFVAKPNDKSDKISAEIRVNITRLQFEQDAAKNEKTPTSDEFMESTNEISPETDSKDARPAENQMGVNENDEVVDENICKTIKTDGNFMEMDAESSEKCQESLEDESFESDTDISVVVNYTSNNTTQNFDTTTTSNMDNLTPVPSFVESTKELSYGETLRSLTGRRSMRPMRDIYSLRSHQSHADVSDGRKYELRYHRESQKRKLEVESMHEAKRARKEDESTGLFSMFSSPFKNKNRTEISCSTPKLLNYKHVQEAETIIEEEFSKIPEEIEQKDTNPSKKWCSIM